MSARRAQNDVVGDGNCFVDQRATKQFGGSVRADRAAGKSSRPMNQSAGRADPYNTTGNHLYPETFDFAGKDHGDGRTEAP
jgi:hypothetical protein